MMNNAHQKKHILPKIGWREWISLPDFNIPLIKAKIDTGARTSAIHALNIRPFEKDGKNMVHFIIRPVQKKKDVNIDCLAEVVDQRTISDSGGHREKRYIIRTSAILGDVDFQIELSLTNRSSMNFRMILGRTALKKRFIIDPATSYIMGNFSSPPTKRKIK